MQSVAIKIDRGVRSRNTARSLTRIALESKLVVAFFKHLRRPMTTKNIKPLGNRILVKRSKMTTSKGGILLPEAAQEKQRQGEVIAVGPGKVNEKGELAQMQVRVGDMVMFSSYSGTAVKNAQEEEEFLIMSEDDILCVVV
jgi:chaperonin GroES